MNTQDFKISRFWCCGLIIRTDLIRFSAAYWIICFHFFYGLIWRERVVVVLGVYLVFAMLPINYSLSLIFSAVYESFTCNVICEILRKFVIRMPPVPNYDLYYLQCAVYLVYF